MRWVAILITVILLDYCVFERKMGVKTHRKSTGNEQFCVLLSENMQK